MANIQEKKLNDAVSDVIEFVNQSRQYMSAHYWDELAETYRALKCRTEPIMIDDPKHPGQKIEDVTRTNVCMPDLNLIWRRNSARLTAQPYRLNYIGGSDPMIADMLSALAIQQYDRSNEAVHDRRLVMMTEGLGWACSKVHWDHIAPTRKFRKALMRGNKIIFRDRKSVMASMGAPMEEIEQAVAQLGPNLSDEEVARYIGRSGNEIDFPVKVSKYEGPVVESIFPGDIFSDPNALTLRDSSRVVEDKIVDEPWLMKQVKTLSYKDENGNDVQAFDEKAVQELIDADPGLKHGDEKIQDLRQMFRNVSGKGVPRVDKRLLGVKQFAIYESHSEGPDGRIWVEWISENVRDKVLGRMPYREDLYGDYQYTELVTLPDIISPIGDSTPRLLRFVHLLLNQTYAQNFDYVSNLTKKFLLVGGNEDQTDEAIVRASWRELKVKNPANYQYLQDPPLPSGAMERMAELWRILGIAEPALNNVESGTAMNPQAGKTATTAVLASKAGDALTAFKLIGRDIYCKELGMKKLWMNQQSASEAWDIQKEHWGDTLRTAVDDGSFKKWAADYSGEGAFDDPMEQWALSDRNGKTVAIRLDPLEMQEDYRVETEAGSYLSVDDDIRRQAATDMGQIAAQAPDVIDVRKVARFALSTIRGIGNPDDYILPEQPANPTADVKKSASFNFPMDKFPADVVNQVLPVIGLQPSAELQHRDTINGVKLVGEAADAAAKLEEPAVPPVEPATPAKK